MALSVVEQAPQQTSLPPRGSIDGIKKRLQLLFRDEKPARQDGSCIALQRVLRPLGRTCLSGSAMHDPSWHGSDKAATKQR